MRAALAAIAAGLFVTACATTERPAPTPRPVAKPQYPASPAAPKPVPSYQSARPQTPREPPAAPPREPEPAVTLAVNTLPGWSDEDHRAGLAAFQVGCSAARDPVVQAVCARARALGGRASETEARQFFERNFVAVPVSGDGMLTAYFAPEYEARSERSDEFSAPVRPRPSGQVAVQPVSVASTEVFRQTPVTTPIGGAAAANLGDLIDEVLKTGPVATPSLTPPAPPAALPFVDPDAVEAPTSAPEWVDLARADRATIERSAAPGVVAWMRPEDLFFLQIQGSGALTFPDGRRMKAVYAGDNGKPFVAIARPMVERGLFKANGASGDAIRGWLAANRGPKADAVMQLNPRYIFFNLAPDDGKEPAGAAGIPLPAGRAIAVDPSRHQYGELFWIDAQAPTLSGAAKTYRRLAMALDTGSAIRGEVRADLYIGRGDAAGMEAGRVRHTLRMVRLMPVDSSRSARRETDAPSRGG